MSILLGSLNYHVKFVQRVAIGSDFCIFPLAAYQLMPHERGKHTLVVILEFSDLTQN